MFSTLKQSRFTVFASRQYHVYMSQEPVRRARRGPYAKTPQRHEQILATALEVFAEHGFNGSTVREIAERTGLSATGILHHFGSKTALLQAVLARRDVVDWAPYRENVRGMSYVTSMREVVRHNTKVPDLIQLFSTLAAEATKQDHPAHSYFLERYENTRAEAVEQFERAVAAGELPDDVDPHDAAALFTAAMDGLQIQWLYDPSIDMVSAIDLLIRQLLRKSAPIETAQPGPTREGPAEGV